MYVVTVMQWCAKNCACKHRVASRYGLREPYDRTGKRYSIHAFIKMALILPFTMMCSIDKYTGRPNDRRGRAEAACIGRGQWTREDSVCTEDGCLETYALCSMDQISMTNSWCEARTIRLPNTKVGEFLCGCGVLLMFPLTVESTLCGITCCVITLCQ